MKYRFWLIIVCLVSVAPVWAAGPSIVLKDFQGNSRNVNEFIGKGKWVVVTIWAHDCHICNQEIYQMTFFHDAHHKKDAVVLGVSVDGWNKRKLAQGFVDEHGLDFTNLIAEPKQSVIMKFGGGPFIGTPTYYIYAPDGKLSASNVGALTQEDVEKFIRDAETAARKGDNKES